MSRFPARERIALGLIVLLAFALRVYRLGAQAIWWDESLSLYRATHDWATLLANTIYIQTIATTDTLPQLYFVFLHLAVPFFGMSEFALRYLSLAANVATVPLIYALAHRWFDQRAALVAALLAALSPFYVWYAQEARPYALVLWLNTVAIYALARAFEFGRARPPAATSKWVLIYIAAAIASLFTHYYSIFLFPVHVILIAMLIWREPKMRAWIFLPAVPGASVILLLRQVTASAASNAHSGPYFVPLDVILRDLLNSFSVGVTADAAQATWFNAAMLALFVLGILFASSQSKIQNSKLTLRIFLGVYLGVPIAGIFALSFIRPLYQNSRYLISISPAFYIGVAAGIAGLMRWRKIFVAPALTIILLGAVLSLNNLYFDPHFGKDDHRAWSASLRERARPGDTLILDSPHTEELYRYYADDVLPLVTLPILRADGIASPEQDAASVHAALTQNSRVWLLAMNVPFDDPDARIEQLLNTQGVLLDETNFAATSTAIKLSLFVQALPTVQPSALTNARDVAFAGHLHLRGYAIPAPSTLNARVTVKLFWQVDEPVGEDYAVSLRLVDETGTLVGQWDQVPLGNRAGSSTWRTQDIIVDTHDVALAFVQPGTYHWQVLPYHAATGNPLGAIITLGEITVH